MDIELIHELLPYINEGKKQSDDVFKRADKAMYENKKAMKAVRMD